MISSNGSQSGNDFVNSFLGIVEESKNIKKKWIDFLISYNIKAAHPEDGWIDRSHNTLELMYPYFGPIELNIGDLLAIGDPEEFRVVRVTKVYRPKYTLQRGRVIHAFSDNLHFENGNFVELESEE